MAKNDQNAARIADGGMTEAEAAYFASGGNSELTLPADGAAGASGPQPGSEPAGGAAAPAPQSEPQPPAANGQVATPQGAPQQPVAGAEDDDDAPSDPNATIPYQKYARDKKRLRDQLRERDDRLTQASTELGDLRQKWARLDERFRVFQDAARAGGEQQQQAQQQPATPPDPETDPFGYMKWLGQQVTAIGGRTNEVATQAREQADAATLQTTFRADAADYTRATPDFWESAPGARDGAYHFLMKSRDAELQAAGYSDPAERLRIIALDERDIVARALQARQQNPQAAGPAAVLYGLAKARGYQGRAPANGAANGAGANGGAPPAANGAGAPAANGASAPVAAQPSVTAQVEAIQRGQAASRSLSSGGGAPVPQGIDLAKLAAMNDGEYVEFVRALTPAQRKEYYAMIGAPN